jgi:hypothetical protein
VLDLDENEEFISFVDYISYESIGFDSSKVDTAAVTNFVFLTYLPRKNLISLNLLLIDTYHDVPAFKNYKSIQKWKYDLKKDRDIVKKAIAYSSVGGSEQKVKILTQFTDHFTIQSQVEQDNDYAEVNTH